MAPSPPSTNGFTSGDVLGFIDQNGISGTYYASTGVLNLIGTATVAQYQTALRSVAYHSTSEEPTTASDTRTVTWEVTDANSNLSVVTDGNGTGGQVSATGKYILIKDFGGDDKHIYRKNLLTDEVEVVDADSQGNLSTGDSQTPLDISADGRYVLFDLDEYGDVDLDGDGSDAVVVPLYRKDMDTGAIDRVDIPSDGVAVPLNWGVGDAALSADGQSVVFFHNSSALMGGDGSQANQIYHKNLVTGELRVVTSDVDGTVPTLPVGDGAVASGYGIGVSTDGTMVSFLHNGGGLVAGAPTAQQLYVKNMATGEVTLASSSSDGTPAENFNSGTGAFISPDGRYVAFTNGSSNLVDGVSGGPQLYVKDLQTGEIEVASATADGTVGDGFSSAGNASFSADGRYLAFESSASNLVSGDTNDKYDIFVKDLQTGAIERVSVVSDGTQVDDHARIVGISDDGSTITFSSYASSIDPAGDNGSDVFIVHNPFERTVVSTDGLSGVLSNDTDLESTTLSASVVGDPTHGTVALNADGSFIYTPDDDYSGTDSFTYKASDGTDASAATTVSLTVTDTPVLSGNLGTLAYIENDGAVVVDNTIALSDADSANLAGATVEIATGYVNGEDVLSLADTANITSSWNAVLRAR